MADKKQMIFNCVSPIKKNILVKLANPLTLARAGGRLRYMVYPIKWPLATILPAHAFPISCFCAGRVSTMIARQAACTGD